NRGEYSVQAIEGSSSSQAFGFQAGAASALRADLPMENWGRIEGTVSAGPASLALPVAGASVIARHGLTGSMVRAVADSLGRFFLAGLASGAYRLDAESKGYRPAAIGNVDVSKGAVSAGIAIRMEAGDAGISGLVADESGSGLEAQVSLIRGRDTLTAATDGSGQFIFAGQPAGEYRLSAYKAGYAESDPMRIDYDGKSVTPRKLTLARQRNSVFGIVRDALTNAPLAGASLRLVAGSPVLSDASGRFALSVPAGAESPVFVEASRDGYIARPALPIYLDADGSAIQDLSLAADYKHDGAIAVSVREGKDRVPGVFVTLQSLHPDDSLKSSVSGSAPDSFGGLRRPAPYTVKAARPGYKDLSQRVELTAEVPTREITLSYPSSRIRVFATSDGRQGKSVDLFLNGAILPEQRDTAGLYAGSAARQPGVYEVAIRDRQEGAIPLGPYFLGLGE